MVAGNVERRSMGALGRMGIVAGMMRLKFWSPGPNRFPHRVTAAGSPYVAWYVCVSMSAHAFDTS